MIGEYIKSLRLSVGLTQRELAKDVGISTSMLSLLEAGKRQPTIRVLRDLAIALHLPSASLFAVALADEHEHDLAVELRKVADRLARATQRSARAQAVLRTKRPS